MNRQLVRTLLESKEDLQKQFIGKGDDFWGVVFHEDEGYSEFTEVPYGGVVCTGFACMIQKKLPGRVKVYGFSSEANPQAAVSDLAQGHDFAVVDDRYIVDPWLIEVESGEITRPMGGLSIDLQGQGVFDMQDDEDKKLIDIIYGDRNTWGEM